MTYSQTIDYLYQKLPLFSHSGAKAFKADLHNITALCAHLGNPQNTIKTIHVAGTNGKGSVSHMLAAIFAQNGYKTGLYTSPHLKDFRERIKINGQMIPEENVIRFVEQNKEITESIKPSFFELTFAMALEYFASQKVDIAIIETGLGGRLDSTNIITPLLSIITNIGLDHIDILGNTRAQIAFEKAGIIKPGIPVVIGQAHPETTPVFAQKANETQSQITYAADLFTVMNTRSKAGYFFIDVVHVQTNESVTYHLDLTGSYQQQNLLTVLAAILHLKDHFVLREENILKALSSVISLTGLHGRWELVSETPRTYLDVAHNVDGVQQLLHQISCMPYRNLHLIFGMVKDKDIQAVLDLLPQDARYYFTNAHIPRALPAEELVALCTSRGLSGDVYEDVNTAYEAAKSVAQREDLIIVFGSVFLVAEFGSGKETDL